MAQQYDPDEECLGPSLLVDVLNGPAPEPCNEPRCWHSAFDEIFITTRTCVAPPDFTDGTQDPPGSDCALALAALEAKELCED